MGYGDVISRTNAEALMPEDVQREIVQGVPQMSAIMQLGRKLPNMTRSQRRLPVLSSLITAYFVNGDTGLKQTSNAEWDNKYVDAEELAVIVPIPEAVLDDTDYDIWGEIKPRIVEAFGAAFDAAVLFGTNAPTAWPTDLLAGAIAASHRVVAGTGADLYEDILGEGGINALVEADGFDVSGHVAAMSMKSKLRGLRDANGMPLFARLIQDKTRYELDGAPMEFPKNGSFAAASALDFAGDWSQLVWALRQDVTYKILDQAVITDGSNNIIYNLAQQDMVALRAVLRLGWQLPNPINRLQPTEASRYPFAVLTP